jgi:hypothetical protein
MPTIERRENAKGETRYRVKARLRGQEQRTRTFKRLTDAKTWATKVEADLGHGAYVPTIIDRRRTLADLIDKFIVEQLPIRHGHADNRNIKARLDWWKTHAGYLALERLTPAAVAGFRSELLARHARRPAGSDPKVPAPLHIPRDRKSLPGRVIGRL